MPNIIYDYKCPTCGKEFEKMHRNMTAEEAQAEIVKCPCGEEVERLPANSNFKPFEWR